MPDRLLDSNAVSAIMKADDRMERYLQQVAEDGRLMTSVIVEGEIRFGLRRLPAGRRRNALTAALARILAALEETLPVPPPVASRYGAVKSELWSAGRALGENDLWIAATALTHGLTLVTADNDFTRVPELTVEDWSQA